MDWGVLISLIIFFAVGFSIRPVVWSLMVGKQVKGGEPADINYSEINRVCDSSCCKFSETLYRLNKSFELRNQSTLDDVFSLNNKGGDCDDFAITGAKSLKKLNFTNVYLLNQPNHVCFGYRKGGAIITNCLDRPIKGINKV